MSAIETTAPEVEAKPNPNPNLEEPKEPKPAPKPTRKPAANSVEAKLTALAAPFKGSETSTRTERGKTLTYISIDATIRRLNEVLGAEWGTSNVQVLPLEKTGDNTASGKPIYRVGVCLELAALGKTAVGVGYARNYDEDNGIKSALAEAIKKAGHQFGVGLYLWSEEGVADAAVAMAAAAGNVDALKVQLHKLALAQGATLNMATLAADLAAHFGVDTAALQDAPALQDILTAANAL